MPDNQIVIAGAGNVATNLAFSFHKNISKNIHIHGKSEASAKALADKLNCPYSLDINDVPKNADLYIISVNDDAVFELAQNNLFKEKINNNLIVHTVGSIPIHVLKQLSGNYGVFYPLQTFSKHKILDFKNIPLCIEANSGFSFNTLNKYASRISDDVRNISSEQRKYIHLAAVFANNFTNGMFSVSEKILKEKGINFDILIPLIEETTEKIKTTDPSKSQTGPAVRNDKKTVGMHLELLKDKPELQNIYKIISDTIRKNA
jgi:predicted short-subunit dehydrogenase-like oxidoreductase (DUF2520 family)